MHALGIVHRDLKFENLLLANETTALAAAHIKICDFGCAVWTRPDARALDVSLAGDGLLVERPRAEVLSRATLSLSLHMPKPAKAFLNRVFSPRPF